MKLLQLQHINLLLLVLFSAADAQDVDGGWTDWEDGGPCCNGRKIVLRSCTNPPPSGQGSFCAGPSIFSFTCSPDNCVNGGWGAWSEYGPCCYGTKRRTRECLAANNACDGLPEELEACTRDGGDGSDTSGAACYTPNAAAGVCEPQTFANVTAENTYELLEDCCSINFPQDYEICVGSDEPPIDGGWGEWTDYGRCCYGSQSRYRACDNPSPANGGQTCEGSFTEERPCAIDMCSATNQVDREISSATTSTIITTTTTTAAIRCSLLALNAFWLAFL